MDLNHQICQVLGVAFITPDMDWQHDLNAAFSLLPDNDVYIHLTYTAGNSVRIGMIQTIALENEPLVETICRAWLAWKRESS